MVLKMIPKAVLEEYREKAQAEMEKGKPVNRAAAVFIITIWVLVLIWLILLIKKILQ